MRKLELLLLFCFIFCCSCTAQEKSNVEWKTFDFSDSGIKIALPCEPTKEAKVFQKEPKLAQRYIYECKKENFDFSVSLAEHFDEFDPNEAKDSFDEIEKMTRISMNSLNDKATLSAKDTTFQTYHAREFISENENRLAKALHILNKRGYYNVQIISTRKPNQSKEDFISEFQKNAQQLFDSVKISINE